MPSLSSRNLLTILLGILACAEKAIGGPLSSQACAATVKAKEGDTCASLAAANGISVSQFLLDNPTISSCELLVVGQDYCIAEDDGGPPRFPSSSTSGPSRSSASSSSPQPSTSLTVSDDGSCGNGVTCLGSQYGSCCSEHGYCGDTDDYCLRGCQQAFGFCGSGSPPVQSTSAPPSSNSPPINLTPTTICQTRTVTIRVTPTTEAPTMTSPPSTRTVTVSVTPTAMCPTGTALPSTRPATVTLTVIAPGGPTATTTTTVTTMTTATMTLTKTTTTPAIVYTTSTTTRTSTSVILKTTTTTSTSVAAPVTSTTVVTKTSTAVLTLTSKETETITSTARTTSTAIVVKTSTTVVSRTVTSIVVGGGGDDHTSVSTRTVTAHNTVTATETRTTTEVVGGACSPTRPDSTITATRGGGGGPPAPSPTLPNMVRNCKEYYKVKDDDTCRGIAQRNGISVDQFVDWNPSIGTSTNPLSIILCSPGLLDLLLQGLCQVSCDGLWSGYYVCVDV